MKAEDEFKRLLLGLEEETHPLIEVIGKLGVHVLGEDGLPRPLKTVEDMVKISVPETVGLDFVDGKRISTVMLPVNHSFKEGKQVFWETMIFDGEESSYQTRCEGGVEDAVAMHKRAIEYVLAGCPEEVE